MDCTFVEEYSLFLSFDFIDFMYNNKGYSKLSGPKEKFSSN